MTEQPTARDDVDGIDADDQAGDHVEPDHDLDVDSFDTDPDEAENGDDS